LTGGGLQPGETMQDLLLILGGLGLFLLGMLVMTDGLRGMAGDALDRWLARFTRSPLTGAITGAAATAVVQSSSATVIAAVGFVSAGLLTFPQALGVVFGANLGTTVTGWMVVLLGHRLQIGGLLLPLILIGALLRLFGHGRWRHLGMALAGFGLLFQGIDSLQAGMAPYRDLFSPESFPADSLPGLLQLLGIGILVTLVTQSSSAGVAMALTAVYTGAIGFEQAAAMVIGMDVGTTVKAVLATIGGSVDTRRTGYSHVLYNLLTAAVALILLGPYAAAWEALAPGALHGQAELALVAFHSLFNLVGIGLMLPFARPFAALVQRLVPSPRDPLSDRLDPRLLQSPAVALDNVGQILGVLMQRLFGVLRQRLRQEDPGSAALSALAGQLHVVEAFVDRLHLQPEQRRDWQRLKDAMHMLDHLQRLHERCEEEPERAAALCLVDQLGPLVRDLDSLVAGVLQADRERADSDIVNAASALAESVRAQSDELRDDVMARVAAGELDVPEGTRRLEGLRWFQRVSYHVWRVLLYRERLQVPATGA
jgi:phosphate:Na+ symporter